MTVVSMALGFGITASFFIAFSSVLSTAQSQVDASTWDLLADFRTPQTWEAIDLLGQQCPWADVTALVRGSVHASAHGQDANLYAGGFDPAKLWYRIPTLLQGHDVTNQDPRGILLEVSTADQLGVGIGDEVALDSTSGKFRAHVIGIFSGAMPGEARMTVSFAQEVFALPGHYTGIFVRLDPDRAHQVAGCLGSDEAVQQVMTRLEIKDQITTLSDQITVILQIGAGVAIVVALLFVLACLGYTVLKRSGDYQVLRSLGFHDRVVVATILAETWLLGVAAVVLAIPVGALTAQYTGWRISQVWFHVTIRASLGDYVQTFVPALLALPVVAAPMARRVLNQSLDQFVRSRDLG